MPTTEHRSTSVRTLAAQAVPDPRVTVAIPALNEASHIDACLASIARQSVRPVQILLVDGGSNDATVDRAVMASCREGLALTVIANPHRRVPSALNLALAACATEYLIRVDAHAEINDRYIEILIAALDEGYDGAGGRKTAVGVTAQGRANAAALGMKVAVGSSRYHYATERQLAKHVPYGAYRRSRALDLGGWDETLLVNQDFEFDHRLRRAGGNLLLDPAAEIRWHCRETLRGHFAQYRRYGSGKAAVLRKDLRSAEINHVAPAVLTSLLAVSMLWPSKRSKLVPLLYVGLLAVAAVPAVRRHRVNPARVAAAIAAMHTGYGVGLIRGAIHGSIYPSQGAHTLDRS